MRGWGRIEPGEGGRTSEETEVVRYVADSLTWIESQSSEEHLTRGVKENGWPEGIEWDCLYLKVPCTWLFVVSLAGNADLGAPRIKCTRWPMEACRACILLWKGCCVCIRDAICVDAACCLLGYLIRLKEGWLVHALK